MPTSRSRARAATGQPVKPKIKTKVKAPQRVKVQKAPKTQRKSLTMRELPEYAQCVLNPFDMPACGYPDYFTQPTLKLKVVDTYLLTSDAAGYAQAIISPSLIRAKYTPTITAGVYVAAAYTAHPDYASITAQTTWARTVCFGVKIEYIGATAASAGTLACIKSATVDYWVGATPEAVMDDGVSGPAREGRMVPMVPTMPPRFEIDTAGGFSSPTFENLHIAASGLPVSTACLRVTVIRHVEALPAKDSTIARGSSTRTPANPTALAAVSGVDPAMQATTATWAPAMLNAVGDAWNAVRETATPMMVAAGVRGVTSALAAFGI